jgi:putative ATP-dependent endonuclease of OLD family
MGIMLTNIRIKNFRSLESIDLALDKTNILIGPNNSGKSNFLKAIDLALAGFRDVSEDDIFVADGERLERDKSAIVEVLFRPTDENGKIVKHFSDYWTGVFTDTWITTDETNGDFVGIKTIIQYDALKTGYIATKFSITEWNESINDDKHSKRKQSFGDQMADTLTSFYMDAQRDIVDDIKNKRSYFGKAISQKDLPDQLVDDLERQLNEINSKIVDSIPALKQTSKSIGLISETIGTSNSSIRIEALARKLSDLHKGMDIIFKDGLSAEFSISQHGMGTRSWISFLTLSAYIDWQAGNVKKEDREAETYAMLTMEEPEAHLHPQAQRQLYAQINSFNGQKVISSHSPSILAQASLGDIIHFEKISGKTHVNRFDISQYSKDELNRIKREVINTRGELLFSNAVVLCEGPTEEQSLPIYFKEYFGKDTIFYGVNIIGIGGQNYSTFLSFIKDFKIRWFIFSDGELKTKNAIKKAIKVISDKDLKDLPNVIILDNYEDYEQHLLSCGYGEIMIEAINECEGDKNFFKEFREKHNQELSGRKKTDKPKCTQCGQDIYEDNIRNYDGPEGFRRAVLDCCQKSKAKYAPFIATKIVANDDKNRRIPTKIKSLFDEIEKEFAIMVKGSD